MSTWYEKCMPRIKDISPYISDLASNIKKISGVEEVYIWGSYSNNKNNLNFRVKDLDILTKVDINSEDLISVDNNIINKICSKGYLEKEGYAPIAVNFSKKFVKLSKFNIDHWVISSDKKLLHWGPIFVDREESKDIKKEAEEYAIKKTGHSINKINKSSEKIRKNWYQIYYHYMNNYLTDMPSGWYLSEEKNTNKIIRNAERI
jgi:hypothetical protein